MPSVLFLSPEPPYPVAGGGPSRTASLIEYLARRFDVDLVLFAVQGASDPEAAVPRHLVRNVFKLPLAAHSKNLLPRLARNSLRLLRGAPPLLDRYSGLHRELAAILNGHRYDAGWIEHFWCAPYIDVLKPACRQTVLDLHNIESEWHFRASTSEPWPLSAGHRQFASHYSALERRYVPEFDHVLVTSEREVPLISAPRTIIYPNTIPYVPLPQRPRTQSIVFSGNLEYHPNQQAVRFFHREIWPQLRQHWPSLKWRILGKNPHGVAREVAADPQIELTGPVPDAILELSQSMIAIVPVLAGSGTRVKILEAWAAGLPVVSTSIGAEGLQASAGLHLLVAGTPAEFAASVSRLLEAEELRAQLASAGRALYEQCYTWDAAWRRLDGEKFLAV
ncbi:MAG: glycosyltransferase [Bryobacterales bacterium]|nr:glycosyltransferase [Bryobacterales bacterium]